MNLRRSAAKRYRSLTTISLLLSGSLLPLSPALADQLSPPPGTLIENQATASFTDAADGSTGTILSDKVSVTVAEVAGISAAPSGIVNSVYRTNIVFFDFKVKNEGNDPTQLFVPAAPSLATIGPSGSPVALPAGSIGQLQVIGYNNDASATVTPITTGNLVNTSTGSGTSALGVPNGGSIAAGGYIIVRVPITVPATAIAGTTPDIISVTLGNTAGQPATTSTPFIAGNNSGVGGNDLYTKDNTGTQNGDSTATAPINGEREASAIQTATVVNPPEINIKGTVIDDANGSGTSSFTNILSSGEAGANVTPAITAILVDSSGKVVKTTPVAADGTYTLTTFGVQNGLYVILSTSTPLPGQPAPTTGSLPSGWTNITPLSYAANAFNVGIVDVLGKDFGIDKLPVTLGVNTQSQANPPGLTKYKVPTLKATDAEDDPTGSLAAIKTFNILTLPDAATQGILYYDNVPVVAGVPITNYDPTKLTFDPVDGPVSMSFTYAAIDAAGKQDPSTTTTATMSFAATPITISGTVYNDKNNSANNTFTNIQDNGEVGTDAVFGTTQVAAFANLLDAGGTVIQTVQVNPNGTYSFTVSASSTVSVVISPAALGLGDQVRGGGEAPVGWVGTSPLQSEPIATGFLPVTQDFGIRQKAKLVLLKRITKVNGFTTNPNDGRVLTGIIPLDVSNTGVAKNWPGNYLVGETNAGLVKPGDTIEYTVYFLNNQGADANGVKICDPIKGSQDFLPGSIKLNLAGASLDTPLTDAADGADRANYYLGGQAPTDCNANASTAAGADNGGVAIGLTGAATTNQAAQTGIPGSIGFVNGIATPAASYGLFRFSTTVKP
jgi:uncharacterized repeat protein (TIGR01451 family)